MISLILLIFTLDIIFIVTPSINDNPPSISEVNYTSRNTSILFIVKLSPISIIPGTVYCISLRNNITNSLRRNIVSSGSSQSYFIGAETVQVIVNNLQASTIYYTYCYVQTINYKGLSLTEILNTYQKVQTLCCKQIKFTNAPLTIYGDISKYNSGTDSKQYLYSFSLSSPPSSSSSLSTITIFPSLYNTLGQLLNESHVLFRP